MLGKKYKVVKRDDHTKDKILLESVSLFAKYGYSTVSVNDIARSVGVKASTIYCHYESKEEILDTIFEIVEDILKNYYENLEKAVQSAQSIDEIIDILFLELKEVNVYFVYFGLLSASHEMFSFERAKDVFLDQFLKKGLVQVKKHLDEAIQKGYTKVFDTETVAYMIMNCVLTGNQLRVAEKENKDIGLDLNHSYHKVCGFLKTVLAQ